MDNSLPTYQRLLAASPRHAPDELEACACCCSADRGDTTTHRCVGDQQRQHNNLQIRHKFSLVSADTNKFSIRSSDTVAQQTFGKKYNNQKQVVGTTQVAPSTGTIKMDKGQQFADRVANQLRHVADDSALSVCQIEGCTKLASIGGGRCTFSIMSGLTKGCGRSFCSDHSGSAKQDDCDNDGDNDYFRANNYDEEYGPDALCPFDKSTDQSSSRSSFQSCDGDNEQPRNAQKSDRHKDSTEKRPFEGQVCEECQPRLRRTYKISVAMFCGVPAVVSLVCLAVLGGGQ